MMSKSICFASPRAQINHSKVIHLLFAVGLSCGIYTIIHDDTGLDYLHTALHRNLNLACLY